MGRYLALLALALLAGLSGGSETQTQPAKVKPLRRIAIAPLKNLRPGTDTDWIGAGAAKTLTIRLDGLPGIITIEQIQIKKVIEARGLQNADFSDPKTGARIGKLLRAERILIGTCSKADKNIVFEVEVIDAETGFVLNAAHIRVTEDKIFDALFQLADAVIKSFDKKVVIVDSRSAVVRAPKVESILLTAPQVRQLKRWSTTSPDAYEAFSRACATKDLGEQVRWYTNALVSDPRYAWAHNSRGFARMARAELNAAIRDFSRAIELDPNYAGAYKNRGLAEWRKGDYNAAIRDFSRAIELDPNYAGAYKARGVVRGIKGDYDAAIRDCTKAIELDPNDAAAYIDRGMVHGKTGDHDAAIRDLTRAAELSSSKIEAYIARGAAYNNKGDHDAAIRDCGRAIELDPNDARIYIIRIAAHYGNQEYAKAWADVRKYQALGGNVDPEFLAKLRKASGRQE